MAPLWVQKLWQNQRWRQSRLSTSTQWFCNSIAGSNYNCDCCFCNGVFYYGLEHGQCFFCCGPQFTESSLWCSAWRQRNILTLIDDVGSIHTLNFLPTLNPFRLPGAYSIEGFSACSFVWKTLLSFDDKDVAESCATTRGKRSKGGGCFYGEENAHYMHKKTLFLRFH